MFQNKKKTIGEEWLPVPAKLPAIEGLKAEYPPARGPRAWLWTLIAALAVVLLVIYVLVLGILGIYDGLRDRSIKNQQIAQEHYERGLVHLDAGDYELAIAEFKLALRYNSNLHDARSQLWDAEELARAQATPTSETRRDAAKSLYQEAVAYYEGGYLVQAAEVLDELRGLDADYQRRNVELMLTTTHYQLGLTALDEDRLDEAAGHFESVLAVNPDDADAQNQLNLLNLYVVALSHWQEDWSAAIQTLKGLYALAPDYKDVELRLHDAYGYRAESYAESGDWCRAATEYGAALQVLPLETTADKRDDAEIRCQATAEALLPTPTLQATAIPTARPTRTPAPAATSAPAATPTPTVQVASTGQGRIAFTSYDAVRQRYAIYVADLAREDAKLLRDNASQPAFARGGKRLAFRNHDTLHLGLGILDQRNDEVSELTAYGEDSTPVWAPDNRQILFASNKHGDRLWRIYAISPDQERGEGEEWVLGQMPTWSPDGRQIAYRGCDEHSDNCGVWVMLAGGFELQRLTTDPSDTAPAWSPEGEQIAFISARDGDWELYLVDATTGQEQRLTDHAGADVAPTWSPDGRRLAFLSSREGTWAVYVLDLRSGQVQKIIATGDAYPEPTSERLSWVP